MNHDSDHYWRDGDVPHVCGLYLDEHQFVDGQFVCIPLNERRSA